MKRDRSHRQWIITGSILIAVFFAFTHLRGIFQFLSGFFTIISPILWAFAIAYILNRPVTYMRKKAFSRLSNRAGKVLSIGVVYLFFTALIVLFICILLPQLFQSILGFIKNLPQYFESAKTWLMANAPSVGFSAQHVESLLGSWEQRILDLQTYIASIAPDVAQTGVNIGISLFHGVANTFIAFIASIYLLYSKDRYLPQCKKTLSALLPQDNCKRFLKITRDTNEVFGKFLTGKLVQCLILGLMHFLLLWIFGFPYPLLVSVIMAIFDIIPIFGAYVGAGVCALLLLLTDPIYALWFLVITLIIQQIDGQLIGPKILGDSTGLTAFWVIVAILIGGGVGGLLGTILGVPVFSVVYSLFSQFINARLEKKGLSTNTADYHSQ